MDINNDLQQINTFVKGMNTDVSDALMDSSQYRYAENVRLATNKDENTGELRTIEGTLLLYNISSYGDIIAMTSIRNLLVLITKKGKGDIINYILVKDTTSNNPWRVVFKSNTDDIPFGDHLSLVTRWESDNNVKLYIADGIHLLMYVNLMSKYENGDYKIAEGFSQVSGTAEAFLNQPSAEISTARGEINAIKVQYSYRLYKLGGSSTTMSPLSKLLVLYKSNNRGYETSTGLVNVPKSVNVSIPAIPSEISDCDQLLIFRISYLSASSTPTVDLIYDDTYVSLYLDTGYNKDSIDYSEYLSYSNTTTVPAVIESKEDYLFSANVRDVQTQSDTNFDSIDTRSLSSGDYYNNSDVLDYNTLQDYNHLFYDPSQYKEKYWQKPDSGGLLGGTGTAISWSYKDDEYIYVDLLNNKYRNTGSELLLVEDQIRSLRPGEVYRYGAVLYDDKGNHSSVKWIADIMAPDNYDIEKVTVSGKQYYKFRLIGIQFVINWSTIYENCPECKAVEIVRCIRTEDDRLTITQGIAGYPLMVYYPNEGYLVDHPSGITGLDTNNKLCSPGIISTNKFAISGWMGPWFRTGYDSSTGSISISSDTVHNLHWQENIGVSNSNFLIFASPEYSYQKDDIQTLINRKSNNIYVRHDAVASTPTSDSGYPNGSSNFGLKRISVSQTYQNSGYDHGVPYSVYLMPNSLRDLWLALKCYAHVGENGGPLFNLVTNDIGGPYTYTYIHNAKIATSAAVWDYSSDHAGRDSSIYPFYINAAYENGPKVYMSVSDYEVTSNLTKTTNDIEEYGFSTVPNYYDLVENQDFLGNDSSFSIGATYEYINWTIPIAIGTQTFPINVKEALANDNENDGPSRSGYIHIDFYGDTLFDNGCYRHFEGYGGYWSYPIGSSGECIVLKQQISQGTENSLYTDDASHIKADIVSIRQNIRPYNGKNTIDSSKYTSFGNLKLANDSQIDVYDGDCFPGVFAYNACHAWHENNFGGGIAQSNVQIIPLYSDIDMSAAFGNTFPILLSKGVQDLYWIQDEDAEIGSYSTGIPAYRYNTAYGVDPTGMRYSTLKYTILDDSKFDTRVFHSGLKRNNEHIDSWLTHGELDFIDVDSRFGLITNLKLFKDKLLFWLERAVGVLSVNERTVLNDIDTNNIVVGTGGTLQRFDYISTIYGMKPNQYEAEVQSNYTQYWWDGYNKEILAYTGGMELIPLIKTKGVTNYINEREESDHPTLAYDTKYDEVLSLVVTKDNIGETLVYNEQILSFSSIYTYIPLYKAPVGNDLYISNNDHIYLQNKQDDENYSTLFGEPAFPKVRIVVNKNNIYTKTFDNITFGGKMYKGSVLPIILNWPIERIDGEYIKNVDHINSPMHHLIFTFETPLKQKSAIRGDKAASVDEYDYRLAIPRNGSHSSTIEYGNRMRGKTMQCEIASDYNSTDFSLQYITTKFRMSWS